MLSSHLYLKTIEFTFVTVILCFDIFLLLTETNVPKHSSAVDMTRNKCDNKTIIAVNPFPGSSWPPSHNIDVHNVITRHPGL